MTKATLFLPNGFPVSLDSKYNFLIVSPEGEVVAKTDEPFRAKYVCRKYKNHYVVDMNLGMTISSE